MCLLLSNRFYRQTENVFYKYLDISRSIKSPSLYLPLSEGFAQLYSNNFFSLPRIRTFLICIALGYTP